MCKPLIYSLILLALVGCGKKMQPWQSRLQQPQVSAKQFTEIVADAIRETFPKTKVEIVEPLEISVRPKAGDSTCYLDNAWQECRDDPTRRVAVVTRHLDALKSTLESMSQNSEPIIEAVVPMIKGKLWLDESEKQGLKIYRERLAGDMYVVYAEDGPNQLAFIDEQQFKAFGLSKTELRAKSIANLSQRLPEVERHGEGPLYMLVAGGTFEASLLLFSNVWDDQDVAVDGRVVVAAPARDLIMFTGENALEAVQQMRSRVEDIHIGGNYLISKTILVRDNDKWVPLVDD